MDACAQATRVTWCSFSPDSRLTRFQGHKLKRIVLFCLASLSFAVLAAGTTIAACEGFGHRGMQTRWRIDLTARALLRATPSSRTESSYADTATFDVGARSFGAIGEDGLRTHLSTKTEYRMCQPGPSDHLAMMCVMESKFALTKNQLLLGGSCSVLERREA